MRRRRGPGARSRRSARSAGRSASPTATSARPGGPSAPAHLGDLAADRVAPRPGRRARGRPRQLGGRLRACRRTVSSQAAAAIGPRPGRRRLDRAPRGVAGPGVRPRPPARRAVHRAAPLRRGCRRGRLADPPSAVVAADRRARRPGRAARGDGGLPARRAAATGSDPITWEEHPAEVTVPHWRALVAEVLDAARRSTHDPAVTLESVLALLEAGEGPVLAEPRRSTAVSTRAARPGLRRVVGEVRLAGADRRDRHRRDRLPAVPARRGRGPRAPRWTPRTAGPSRWSRSSPRCSAWSATATGWRRPTPSCARRSTSSASTCTSRSGSTTTPARGPNGRSAPSRPGRGWPRGWSWSPTGPCTCSGTRRAPGSPGWSGPSDPRNAAAELRKRMLTVWQGDTTDQVLRPRRRRRTTRPARPGDRRPVVAAHAVPATTARGAARPRRRARGGGRGPRVARRPGRHRVAACHARGPEHAQRDRSRRDDLGTLALLCGVVLTVVPPGAMPDALPAWLAIGGFAAIVVAVLPDVVLELAQRSDAAGSPTRSQSVLRPSSRRDGDGRRGEGDPVRSRSTPSSRGAARRRA